MTAGKRRWLRAKLDDLNDERKRAHVELMRITLDIEAIDRELANA